MFGTESKNEKDRLSVISQLSNWAFQSKATPSGIFAKLLFWILFSPLAHKIFPRFHPNNSENNHTNNKRRRKKVCVDSIEDIFGGWVEGNVIKYDNQRCFWF
jgi:hypothetical protein